MKSYFVYLGLITVLIMGGSLVWNTLTDQPVATRQYLRDELARLTEILERTDSDTPAAADLQRSIAKLKDRIAGKEIPEEAGGMGLLHRDIRTPEDLNAPAYRTGNKIIELEKAQARRKALGLKSAPLPWIERGPGNVSGRTRGILFDATDASGATWWAGSVGGGIWKTTDFGATWLDVAPDLSNLSTATLAQSVSTPSIFYAGTGEGFGNIDAISGDGLLKSTDGGVTWQRIPSTTNSSNFEHTNTIVIDPTEPSIVLVATNSGIYGSTTGGDSWQTVLSGQGRIQHLLPNPGNFSTLYATANGSSQSSIWKSTNAGQTWFKTTFSSVNDAGRIELAIAHQDTALIYAAAADTLSALYVSRNSGGTWAKTVSSIGPEAEPDWMNGQGWYNNALWVNPSDKTEVFAGGVDMWRLIVRDNNERIESRTTSWTPSGNPRYVHADHHRIITYRPPGATAYLLLNANDGGVAFSSNSGRDFTQLSGMNTTQFYGAAKRPGSSAYIGGTQDNGTWVSDSEPDSFSPWTKVLGGDGFEVVWDANNPNRLIGGSQRNGLYRSLDGGVNWTEALTGLTDVGTGLGPFITRLASSPLRSDVVFAVGKSGVWKSENFGQSWVSRPLSENDWGFSSSGSQVAVSPVNASIVWAGSRMGNTARPFVSSDGGDTFTATGRYTDATLGTMSGLVPHQTLEHSAFLLFSFSNRPHILRTDDLGATWRDISGFESGSSTSTNGFPNVATYSIIALPHNPTTLWAGTEIGLFESTDDGASWHYADNGLPAVSIWKLTVAEDEVVAATHGRGVWTVKIPELLEGQKLPPLVTDYRQPVGRNMEVDLYLRSLYDSVQVSISGQKLGTIDANSSPGRTTFSFLPTSSGQVTLEAVGFIDGSRLSGTLDITVRAVRQAARSYSTNFASSASSFYSTLNKGGSMTVRLLDEPGLESAGIHTPHPYSASSEMDLVLSVPIIIGGENATVSFDEIALVQPGIDGFPFNSPQFRDYVVVEATKEGTTWIPLEDGYDSRAQPGWLQLFESKANPNASHLVRRTVNLTPAFAVEDTVLVRFRLLADNFEQGWGWFIDDLSIDGGHPVGVEPNEIPEDFSLSSNYPNPFSESTTLTFTLGAPSQVTVELFDSGGRKVSVLLDEVTQNGTHTVKLNGSGLAQGMYVVRMRAAGRTRTQKVLLIR